MPTYQYACLDCENGAKISLGRELDSHEYDMLALFETYHSIKASGDELLKAITCPRCNGVNCEISIKNSNVIGYVRGNGFLDKAGAKRDMNIHTLTNDDPYAEYRQPGEVDEIKSRLKKAGKRGNKRYLVNKSRSK